MYKVTTVTLAFTYISIPDPQTVTLKTVTLAPPLTPSLLRYVPVTASVPTMVSKQ